MRSLRSAVPVFFWLSLVCLVIAACSGDDADTVSVTLDRLGARPNPENLEVLSLGDIDGDVLVLLPDLTVGDRWEGTMIQALSIDNGTDQAAVTQSFAMTVEVLEVADNGDVTTVQSLDAVEATGADPATLTAMNAQLDTVEGTSFTVKVDAFGSRISQETSFPEGIDPALRDSMDQFREVATNAVPPVPRDALGVGARWTATSEDETNGITTVETVTYELTAIEGDTYTIGVTTSQARSGLSTQGDLEFDVAGSGEGTGTSRVSRVSPMPIDSLLSSSVTTTVNAAGGGSTTTVVTELTIAERT